MKLSGGFDSFQHAGLPSNPIVQKSVAEIQATIDGLISPPDNSLDEQCARIQRILTGIVFEDIVKWYAIEGE